MLVSWKLVPQPFSETFPFAARNFRWTLQARPPGDNTFTLKNSHVMSSGFIIILLMEEILRAPVEVAVHVNSWSEIAFF